MNGMELWRTAAIAVVAIGQTAFVILYLTLPWRRSYLGRALFTFALSLALFADVIVVGRVWDWKYEEQTFIALYSFVGVGVWYQFLAFLETRISRRELEAGFQKPEE